MLTIVAASCSNDDNAEVENSYSDNICFAISSNNDIVATKGAMFSMSNQPESIGVFAYYDYDSIFINNGEAVGSGAYWTFNPSQPWTTPFLDIITYAPYADSTNGLTIETSEQELLQIRYTTPAHADDQPDFIYSAKETYMSKSLINLSYEHLLSAVSFTIKSTSIDFSLYDAEISMRYLYTSALLSVNYKVNLDWSEYQFDYDNDYYIDVEDTTTTGSDGYYSIQSDGYYMFLPQILTGNALATLTLTHKSTQQESEYYFRFIEFEEWVEGSYYNYIMYI